jgi:acylglycerol lipase
MVTDPRMSEMLYNESRSTDKTIKLYCGMYHNLTTGETDENIDTVFDDAISWVTDRSRH